MFRVEDPNDDFDEEDSEDNEEDDEGNSFIETNLNLSHLVVTLF